MTEIIGLPGSPLRKLADQHAEQVAQLELVISEQKALLDQQRVAMNRIRGSGDMLRLQLADLSNKLAYLADQIGTAQRNVEELRKRIPDFDAPSGEG